MRSLVFLALVLLAGGASGDPIVPVSDADYLTRLGTIRMVVDPDWYPYETIDAEGKHEGIAAELVRLIASRAGVSVELLPTKDWNESLAISQAGQAQIISFLNQTAQRDQWLVFTEPYFTDPNVFITREDHDYISDPAWLSGETVALPEGTSIEEFLRKDYPNLRIILTKSEQEAIRMVDQRKAHMTLRSLTMAAYTIKKDGLFNLKIAGQMPSLTNRFRIGVVKSEPRLRDILNRGVATITPQDVRSAVNRFIAVKEQTGMDYSLAGWVAGGAILLGLLAAFWIRQLRRLNVALAHRDAEKALILREVHHRIKNNMNTVQGLLVLHASLITNHQAKVALQDAQNRIQSFAVLYDHLYQSQVYGATPVQAYFSDLVDRILENFPRTTALDVEKHLGEFSLSVDQVQPLGILVNELLTNTMKYAFVGRTSGRISIEISLHGTEVRVILQDDGLGVPESVSLERSTGFGLQLVVMLARQLGGSIRLERSNGSRFVLTFPYKADPDS